MVRATVTVTKTPSGDQELNAVNAGIGMLKDAVVYVGIPEKETTRRQDMIGPLPKEHITNAGLLYIHTNGSQLHHIPPRPVIEPAIESNANRLRIESLLFKAAQSYMDGKKAEGNRYVKQSGQFASNASKQWFTDPRNGWAQNSPNTIRRKLGKKPRTKKPRLRWLNARTIVNLVPQYMPLYGTTALDTINTPLIDTAQLRRSITWVPGKLP